MRNTIPIFIVGSGRSGTRMIFKLLSGKQEIEVYHEYLCTHIQPLSAKYFMGLIKKAELKREIGKLHKSAIYYSEAKYWVDSSNKLSWIIEPLYEIFSNAKFINITRDGRKVTSSFFHKLSPEIYDDKSVSVMLNWLKNPTKFPEPPAEKKYWWNIPRKRQPFFEEFEKFDQYERICYHWTEVNRIILESFKRIPKKNYQTFKLEELTTNRKVLSSFLSNFEIELTNELSEFVKIPQNVFFPMDFNLDEDKIKKFNKIAGSTMRKLGYTDKETYKMNY